MAVRETARPRRAHAHTFTPYPADARYGVCKCGESARLDGSGRQIVSENPCVALYGLCGDAEARCRTCVHLLRDRHHDKTYLKCALRKLTRGAGTDHRAKWQACARFVSVGQAMDAEIERRKATGADHWYCEHCDANVRIGHVHEADVRAKGAVGG